jgi:hypothetical protein
MEETIVYCKSSKEYSYYIFRDNGEELEFMIKDNILSSFKQLKEHEIQFIKHNLIK